MPQDLNVSYLGLTIDDRDPQAVIDNAIAIIQSKLPTWNPRNGSLEVILLEAIATAEADVIYALNRLPGIVVEGLLNLYGVARDPGQVGTGTVAITLDSARDITVAAGQRFAIPSSSVVLTTTAATSATGATSITVPVATADYTAAANGTPAGTALDILDLVPYATEAVVATTIAGGADAESDAAYLDRASAVFARVTSSLVLPVHFTAYCVSDVRVGRATTVDLFQPGGTAGSELGHLTVYVYGKSDQLSAAVREELRQGMQAISSAMVTVHVEPVTITAQDVTLEVKALSGYSTTAVRDAVNAALSAYLSPSTWAFGQSLRPTEIIAVASAVTGVDYVVSVTTPGAPVTVGDTELVAAGTLTTTVS